MKSFVTISFLYLLMGFVFTTLLLFEPHPRARKPHSFGEDVFVWFFITAFLMWAGHVLFLS